MMKTSVRWKIIVPVIACLIFGVTVTVFVTGYEARRIVLAEIEASTMTKLRDTVLISMTTLMKSGGMKENKASFIAQMKQTADLSIVRSRALDKDFGASSNEGDYAQDQKQRDAIDKGAASVTTEGGALRGIYPYVAKNYGQGKNCLECHNVPEGTVLGAVDIRIPLVDSMARIRSCQYLFAALGALATLLLTALVYALATAILAPLEVLTKKVAQLGSGDLTVSFKHQSGDEIGVLGARMNELVETFRGMLCKITASSNEIVAVVTNLNLESSKVAEGSEQEEQQIMQIATANEEMAFTSGEIATSCHMAEQSVKQANAMAQQGSTVVKNTILVMENIANRVTSTARTVENLGSRSDQIGAIVGTIEDIADQTNLLALNAAIEAARAGEQGRGFAVVADEVRALAERTTMATKEIGTMIRTIQAETKEAVLSMKKGVEEVGKGTQETARSGDALDKILVQISSVTDQICQIATAAEEQTATIHEINRSIQIVATVAGVNRGVGRNVSQEVAGLTTTAQVLKASTTGFRLR